MKKAKLSVVVLLLLAMVLTMLPVTALAADVTDDVTPALVEETVGTVQEEAAAPQEEEPAALAVQSGEGGISVQSMMPLKEVYKTLDYTKYLPHELQAFPVSQLISDLGMTETPAVYAMRYFTDKDGKYHREDEFVKFDAADTIDLYGRYPYGDVRLEVIGGTADQLDLNNTRYIVTVNVMHLEDVFNVDVYTLNRQKAEIGKNINGSPSFSGETNKMQYMSLYLYTKMDDPMWDYLKTDNRYYVALALNEKLGSDVTVTAAYKGEDVTDVLFGQTNMTSEGGLLQTRNEDDLITVTFKRNGAEGEATIPYRLHLYDASMSLNADWLYADRANGSRYEVVYSSRYSYDDYETRIYMLDPGYAADGTYYVSLSMYNPMDDGTVNNGIAYVKKAVVGYYANEAAIPASAADIKDQLFSRAYRVGGGYGADFSKGVVFTVIDTDNHVHHIAVKTIPFDESIALSSDTYMNMYGARQEKKDDSGYTDDYSVYVLDDADDDYYANGYQTVFLMNRTYDSTSRQYSYTPVTDQNIRPSFTAAAKVNIFASVGGGAAVKQTSGESLVPFTSGKAIQYSASAEDGANLANYWVTFLTQQSGGPQLFVNATNDESRYVEVNGTKMPQREVYLNEDHDNKHDVFFANVGDANMTGLYVKLENAENVKLDDYWTVGDTKTLSAFTTTDEKDSDGNYVSYGELANVAKVRLVPVTDADGNVQFGAISGTLVIGYTGSGTEPVEEVRINLTGIAGTPTITTTSVLDGVKYVPYSSVIQTNNMYGTDKMAFSVTNGKLPDGLTLKPNGEIYGIPTKVGEYTFTVTALYDKNEELQCRKTYTITIKDNTDANVLATNDDAQGYPLLDAVPDVNVRNFPADGVTFRSEGAYAEFVAFYLDGKKLVDGTDYVSSEGSTRIVIQSQTFKNAGNGTHTISAEFRTGGTADGEMHRTSQNVDVTGARGGSSGGSGSTGGSTGVNVGNVNAAVGVLSSAAKKIAGGDMSYVTEVRTGAVKSALNKGNGIIVSIEQEIISVSRVPSADKALLDKTLGNGGSADVYMSIVAVIKDGTTGEILGYLSQLPGKVQFTVDVPQSMLNAQKDGKYIYVLRIHDGKAEYLDTTIRSGKASFSSDKFSTYALVVVDQKVQGVKTGDPGVMLYAVSAVAAAAAGAGVVMFKKRRKED